ncbi:hypothetical protein [Nocardia vulneris]|uniref:Uncharacterized protein n=1 Tax=Nocardia vulneris TaxID=1141657 RepID=A0ABR4ZCH2_9NOCA|nr:hypothetical protein [Nocardia vulneris]KIA63009.1 hypothetical protein FG87_21815 [Nocardia vulneris]
MTQPESVWDVYDSNTNVVYSTATAEDAGQAVDEALACVPAGTVLAGVQRRTLATGDLGPMIGVAHVAATGEGDA